MSYDEAVWQVVSAVSSLPRPEAIKLLCDAMHHLAHEIELDTVITIPAVCEISESDTCVTIASRARNTE